jgi:hypothetical protein
MTSLNIQTILDNESMGADVVRIIGPFGAVPDLIATQAVWTGAPVGTISLLISLDGVNYSQLEQLSISGTPDNVVWQTQRVLFKSLAVVYTRTSGTGNLSFYMAIKDDAWGGKY